MVIEDWPMFIEDWPMVVEYWPMVVDCRILAHGCRILAHGCRGVRTLRRRTLRRRTLRRNFSYLRLCGSFVLTDDMIYNYTKSCNKHNPLILWSLLILDTIKILKEACSVPPEARKKKHVIKDRRILIALT